MFTTQKQQIDNNFQCGIFSMKHRLVQLIISVLELSKNLSSPLYGNIVVAAVTLAIGEDVSKIAYFSHSAR